MKDALGIDASFGGEGIQRFQELVGTVTADRAGGVANRGPLPAGPRLFITEVDVGSFGFLLAELEEPALFNLPSPLKEALDETTRLLSAAGDSDDALVDALSARSPRVLNKLKELLVTIDRHGATLKIDTGRARSQLDTVERVRAAKERAEAVTLDEAEETVSGVLVGLLQDRKRFELRLNTGELRAGRVDGALDLATLVPHFNQRIEATLRRMTAARGGHSRTAWVLLRTDAPKD